MVPMIAMQEMGISHDIVNVNGGACAMGHPIGASGARILITLLAAMEDRDAKKGVASLCIGIISLPRPTLLPASIRSVPALLPCRPRLLRFPC